VRRPDEGGVVEIPARDGSHGALVCCLPFVAERRFSDAAALFEDPAVLVGDYDEKMGALLEAMGRSFRADRVNIVMGHLFVDGALIGGGEREVTIGRNYAVSPARIPKDATYVALGHIHRPQQMKGCPAPTYYCGSLLQLDFGERDQDKSVYVVEAVPAKPAKVTQIELASGRRLVDLPEAALDELSSLAQGLEDAFLRVHVKTEGPVPGIADRVRELLPNALEVHLSYERRDATEGRPSLRGLEPRAQFLSYYESVHGAEPTDELMTAFDRVYEEAQAP
jgi:DNA repair protein SbcD/Mre11